jgi:hypothetical protein
VSGVPDRKKLRRDYLRKKRRLNALQIVGFCILLPCILAPIAIAIGLLAWYRFSAVASLSTLAALGCWLLLVRKGWRALLEVERRERTLPYVPPVTLNTLPANEVLVRGSQQPATPHKEVLLRPAQGGETPADQLLRIVNSDGDDATPLP